MSRLVDFTRGQAPDTEGRYLHDIWTWDDIALESVHDFIQWLFPLKEKSGFNPTAPTLTDDVIQAFKSREELKSRLLRSLDVMLAFYGLYRQPGGEAVQIVRSDEYEERKEVWVRPSNHNHLRLTRILTSLRLM